MLPRSPSGVLPARAIQRSAKSSGEYQSAPMSMFRTAATSTASRLTSTSAIIGASPFGCMLLHHWIECTRSQLCGLPHPDVGRADFELHSHPVHGGVEVG